MSKNFLQNKKVLFFGLKNCKNSIKAIEFLKELGCDITLILGKKRGQHFPSKALNWSGDFIFSYRCYWLIPKDLLNRAKYLALNFHPSIPEYPGSGSCSWAIYNSAREFGLTVHLMNERYDNGKILKVYKFKIHNDIDLKKLLNLTYNFSLRCFKKYLILLNKQSIKKIEIIKSTPSIFKWSNESKNLSDLKLMRIISLQMSKNEIEKRLRAFYLEEFPLTLEVNDKKYKLTKK